MVKMDVAAAQRKGGHSESRAACFYCGLRPDATCHGEDWWQHDYEPGILTRNRWKTKDPV